MENLESERTKYLIKLKSDINLLQRIINRDIEKINIDKKNMISFLMPVTENELKYADSLLTFIKDVVELSEDINNGNINIDIENSVLLKTFVNLINAIQNKDKKKIKTIKKFVDNMSFTIPGAKLYYEIFILSNNNSSKELNEFMNHLSSKVNFKSEVEFNKLVEKSLKIITFHSPKDLDINNNSLLEGRIEFQKEFHRLYSLGTKENYNQRVKTK